MAERFSKDDVVRVMTRSDLSCGKRGVVVDAFDECCDVKLDGVEKVKVYGNCELAKYATSTSPHSRGYSRY